MSQAGFPETCIQGGDGLLEPNREDLQASLDKFIWAEKCLLSGHSDSPNFSLSTSLKNYRECYFQLLSVVFRRDLTKLSIQNDAARDNILGEIFALQEIDDRSVSSFRIENDLIEASVSYVNHHCSFQQDHDADILSDKIQLLNNMRNALLRLATTCQRQLSSARYGVPFISSRALLELQVETIDAAQAKSLERASHLDLRKSCNNFKTLLADYETLQHTNTEQNGLKKLLHIGRINGYLFIAAGKIFFETVGIVSGLLKETEFQLQSSESVGSEEVVRYDEALFNFNEAKCTLLSLLEGELTSNFEETFRQTFYIFVQTLFCFVGKLGRRDLDVVALNSLEEKILNVLKGSVLADRAAFVKGMAQFHGYVALRMEAVGHNAEGIGGDAVVNDLMLVLTAQNVQHWSISAEDIFFFVSEIKRQRWVNQAASDVCITSSQSVLGRLNDAVTKFMRALYCGGQVQILEISEAHDSCLASLWASRMFPIEVSNYSRTPNRCSEDTIAVPELTLDSDLLGKEDEDIITSPTDMALRCHNIRAESQTSGVCDSSDRDEITAAACGTFDLVSESETKEENQETRVIWDTSSNEITSIAKEKEVKSYPVLAEEAQEEEEKIRKIRSTCSLIDRQKRTKKQRNRKPHRKQTFAIIAEAAKIIRELKKARYLFSTVLQYSASVPHFPKDEKEKEEEAKGIIEEEEEKKEIEENGLMVEEEKKEDNDLIEEEEKKKENEAKGVVEEEEEKKEIEENGVMAEEEEEEAKKEYTEKEEKDEDRQKVEAERLKVLKTKEKETKGRFANQKRVSKTMQLRAAEVSETLFSTSALVRPSFRPVFRSPSSEPTCVRLDRQLCKGPASLRRRTRREVEDKRDAAFSRLAQSVLRGQNLPIDQQPEAFCADVDAALRRFVSAHKSAAGTGPAVVATTPPVERKVAHQTFADDLDIEPRGDGSFVVRKRRLQAPPKTPRGATPLYGRCRI